MLKQLSYKRIILLVAALAATALAAPSLASAQSWGPLGTTHVLDSTNLEFTIHTSGGPWGIKCTEAQLHVDVTAVHDLTVTDLGFPRDCHGTNNAAGCTVTMKATKLRWTMDASATDNVMIHGVELDARFETRPPVGAGACLFHAVNFTITGTLRGGVWDATQHEVTFNKPTATGLTAHSVLGNNLTVTTAGDFRDTTQSLVLL